MTDAEDFILIEKVNTNIEEFVLIEKVEIEQLKIEQFEIEQFEIIKKTYLSEPFWGKVVNKN